MTKSPAFAPTLDRRSLLAEAASAALMSIVPRGVQAEGLVPKSPRRCSAISRSPTPRR